MIERWNPLFAVTPVTSTATTTDSLKAPNQQATQNGILIKLGLPKRGNLMNWWMIERWRPVVCLQGGAHMSQTRFSRELKNVILEEEENHDRTEKTCCLPLTRSASTFRHWRRRSRIRFIVRIQIILAQGEWSSATKTKTILNGCNRRQWRAFCDMVNVHVLNIIAIICIYSDNGHSIKNSKDLTMKQMFDISEKLVSEQSGEIHGVKTINWEDSSWKFWSLIGDEQVISLQRTKVNVFSDSVLCLGKIHENPRANTAWEERLAWFKSSPEYRNLDRIDGEPIEFEWNIFPVFTTLQLKQSSRVTVEIGWHTSEFYRKDHVHVDVQRHLMEM